MRTLRALPVLVLAVSAACATGGSHASAPHAALLSNAPDVRPRGCTVAQQPSVLPQAAALVDEPALRAAAAGLWRTTGGAPGYALFSLRYDREGANIRRAVVETDLPDAVADSLQQLVFAFRRDVAPAAREWGVRLRVDLGPQPELRVGRWQVCAPVPRDGRLGDASFTSLWDVRDGAVPVPSQRVWLRVRLDANGAVTDVSIARTDVRGFSAWRLVNLIRTMPFRPALEDGYPVPGETTLAFSVTDLGPAYGLGR